MAKNPSHSSGEIERLWKEIVGEDLPHEQAIHLPSSKMAKTSAPTKQKRAIKNTIGETPKSSNPMAKNLLRPPITQIKNKITTSIASTSLPDYNVLKKTKLIKRSLKSKKELLSDRIHSTKIPNGSKI